MSESAAELRSRDALVGATALHARLLAGDESAFAAFVDEHYATLFRIARWTSNPMVAEDMIQQAFGEFCGALGSLDPARVRAEPYRALVDSVREQHVARADHDPFAADTIQAELAQRSVPDDRFLGCEHRWSGGWAMPPQPFPNTATTQQASAVLDSEIESLPLLLRLIVVLRDVAGLSLAELGSILDLPESQLRCALHRARSRLRAALETHYRNSTAEVT